MRACACGDLGKCQIKSCAQWFVEKVGVALVGLHLSMAEQLADHRQRHAARDEQRREGVAQIVNAVGGQFGLVPHIVPEPLDVPSLAAWRLPKTGSHFLAPCF